MSSAARFFVAPHPVRRGFSSRRLPEGKGARKMDIVRAVTRSAWQRRLHVVCTLLVGLMLAAPMVFGPGASWVLRSLGAAAEHTCLCGMRLGTCGCPECDDLAKSYLSAKKPSARPVVRRDCEDDGDAPRGGALPQVIVPAALAFLAAPVEVPVAAPLSVTLRPRDREKPPSPPPRTRAA
jgi:hypothetical protein